MSRLLVCAVLFAASGLLVTQRTAPVVAQDKNKAPGLTPEMQIAALKKELTLAATQVNLARGETAQAVAALNAQKNVNAKLNADANQLDVLLKKEKAAGAKAAGTIKDLQGALDGFRKAGLVRVMILKLKEDSPVDAVAALIDDVPGQLAKVKGVRGAWVGPPSKDTPDAATGYTVAVVLAFDDAAALKAFLKDTAYDKFTDKHFKKWEAPTVYDFEPKKGQ